MTPLRKRTWSIFFRIALNLAVRASDFFFSKLWPFCAPLRRVFIMVCALIFTTITVKKCIHSSKIDNVPYFFQLKKYLKLHLQRSSSLVCSTLEHCQQQLFENSHCGTLARDEDGIMKYERKSTYILDGNTLIRSLPLDILFFYI